MQKFLLENIIRKFLFEQGGKLSIDLGKVTDRDRAVFTKELKQTIMKKQSFTVKDAGVVRIDITRTGGRTEVGDEKKSLYNEASVLNDALGYLNRFQSGLLSTHTGKDFVWFLLIDPYTAKTDKEEKIRAKYSVLAMYVRTTLLFRTPESGAGYLDTLSRGAMVYNLAKITNTEWKPIGKTYIDEPPIQGGEVIETIDDLPFKELAYGTKYTSDVRSMNMLYAYFEKNFNALNILNIREFKKQAGFRCELKSIIEQFQYEQNIPTTGIWDKRTRTAAVALKDLEYTIKNTNELKERYKTCQIENNEIVDEPDTNVSDIKLPEIGYFKYAGPTADPNKGTAKDPEFYKVQQLMANALQVLGFTKNAKHKDASLKYINAIKKYPGDYGDSTKAVVGKLKNVMIQAGSTLNNTSNEIVDQQFINILKTIK